MGQIDASFIAESDHRIQPDAAMLAELANSCIVGKPSHTGDYEKVARQPGLIEQFQDELWGLIVCRFLATLGVTIQ